MIFTICFLLCWFWVGAVFVALLWPAKDQEYNLPFGSFTEKYKETDQVMIAVVIFVLLSPILGLFYLIKSLPKFSVVFKKMFNLKQNHHIEELEDELVALKAALAELEEKKEKD